MGHLNRLRWLEVAQPLLPDRTPKRGGRWRDHREVIDAIAFTFRTGTQRVHLPEKCGNWRGVYNRLRMWAARWLLVASRRGTDRRHGRPVRSADPNETAYSSSCLGTTHRVADWLLSSRKVTCWWP
ncbi:transposase [Streptomyces lydicus]|uniref:transposase n=1 Tax=Streptomyces lydicus TaxID=47763 RepID=UPI0037BA025C